MRDVRSFITPETSGASIKVLEDNQRVKALIEKTLSFARNKHIGVRFHFIRDLFMTRKTPCRVRSVGRAARRHSD